MERKSETIENKKKVFTIQLIIVNYCNLDCMYCYVRKGRHDIMPFEIAKHAILDMLEEYPPAEWRYFLNFMGGEPLLAFDRIREICEWIWNTFPDIDMQISSPTNGTLLDETKRMWLAAHKDSFSLCLSFDGRTVQNQNRSQSLSRIDLCYFHDTWPQQPLKMTISEDGIENLASNIIELQRDGFLVSANVAWGEKKWAEQSIAVFGEQMLSLADYYIHHPELPLVDLIDIDIRRVLLYQNPMLQRCGVGKNFLTIDIDGMRYACHVFSSLALDTLEIANSIQYHIGDRVDYVVSECISCIFNQICPRCYGMLYKEQRSPFSIDRNICALFRQQVRGTCSYHIKRMSAKKNLDDIDHQLIVAIREIIHGNFYKQ